MGGLWPQLGGGISQLSLLAIARGWVCPTWQMSPSFWPGLLRAAGPWRWEAQSCLPGPHCQGPDGQPGGPSEDLEPVPIQPPTGTVWGGITSSFAVTLVPRVLPSPRVGRKYLVQLVLGTGS